MQLLNQWYKPFPRTKRFSIVTNIGFYGMFYILCCLLLTDIYKPLLKSWNRLFLLFDVQLCTQYQKELISLSLHSHCENKNDATFYYQLNSKNYITFLLLNFLNGKFKSSVICTGFIISNYICWHFRILLL